MSDKENNTELNKNMDKTDDNSKINDNNVNSSDDENVKLEETSKTNLENMTQKELIENNLSYAMQALGIKSTDTTIIYIDPSEEIFPKKITKYKVVKHYIKGEKLGNGSFATVREFVDKKSLKRIAGKIFKRKELERKPYKMEHLQNDFKLVGKFDHQNVIKLLDKYETDRKIYLFMEYGTAVLQEFLNAAPNKKLPKWQCHRYFTHIIEGLDYLHSNGVYHRDIKPDNLIVDSSDTLKICDFGVCHIVDWFAPNDMIIDKYVGTQSFQPPELLDVTKETIVYSGPKFDVWSSGVTLYHMICGDEPFTDNESITKVKLHYPTDVTDDHYLCHLFKQIFIKDFTKRITITNIKKHSWFIRHHPPNSKPVSVPIQPFGDIYRSMTVLPRIESHYYPREDNSSKAVTEAEHDKTHDPKYRITPTIRSSRKRKIKRSPLKQSNNNPAKRVLLGIIEK